MAGETARTRRGFGLETARLTGVHWLAIGLAAFSGVVHLYMFATREFVPFLLAGLGFFGAIALVLFDVYRRWVYLAGIPYTLAQMAGWYLLDGQVTTIAVADKTAQLLLVVALAYLFWAAGRGPTA